MSYLPLPNGTPLVLTPSHGHSAVLACCWPLPLSTGPKLDSVFLVFEYCPHDMGKLVDSLTKPFHESEVKCLMQQVGWPASTCCFTDLLA